MKILYLTKGDHVDYQNDALLIGLKELFGADVLDLNKQESQTCPTVLVPLLRKALSERHSNEIR